jgi:hypothetical protein
MEKLLLIAQAGVAGYLTYKTIKSMMELTAAVEEVAVEEDSGSLINDVGDLEPLEDLDVVSNSENGFGSLIETEDAEFSEVVNGTPAVDVDVDEDSHSEFEFEAKSNPDDDEAYLKAMNIDTDFSEDEGSEDMLPTLEDEDEPEQNRAEWLSGYPWAEAVEEIDDSENSGSLINDVGSKGEIFINGYSSCRMLLPLPTVPTIEEEDESEGNRADGLSGFDWAEECDSDSE